MAGRRGTKQPPATLKDFTGMGHICAGCGHWSYDHGYWDGKRMHGDCCRCKSVTNEGPYACICPRCSTQAATTVVKSGDLGSSGFSRPESCLSDPPATVTV